MKKVIAITLLAASLVGFSSESDSFIMFEENGNTTKDHALLMQSEWCKHNEGESFVTTQCDNINN